MLKVSKLINRESESDYRSYVNIFSALVFKNLFGRYKNSLLGFGWNFITPMIMMLIYYVVFTGIRQGSLPNFWIFLASGLFPFHFMVSNLIGGSNIIVGNVGMIKKMYFPREIIVYAQVFSSFIIMIIGYAIVLIAILLSGNSLSVNAFMILPLFVTVFFFVTGYALIISALTVYVRDLQHFLSSINIVFFFVTPMYFTVDSVTGILSTIVWFNPFTYYVESFHQIIYFGNIPDIPILLMCIVLAIVSLILGHVIFGKLKRGFAERL